jgi:DNA-3-methyladenine glycosylase II
MPLTRSASRAAALYDGLSNVKAMDSTKRRAEEPRSNPSKKLRSQKTSADDAYKTSLSAGTSSEQFLPATLKFSFEEGKQHLISVDGRFEKLFNRTQCKPFEQLETVHPFRCDDLYPLGR